jgi:hypothetical protein
MDQFRLNWEGPFKVSELRRKIFDQGIGELFKDCDNFWMSWQGVYAFLDKNSRVLYIGSATKGTGYALRWRIRKHLKGETDFSRRLKGNTMNIDDLQLIAAPDQKEDLSYEDILKIEGILIREMNPPGNSDDVVEVVNYGSFKPALPERVQAGLSGYLKAGPTK